MDNSDERLGHLVFAARSEWADDVIPLADLQAWGEEFQRLFRLSDHSGYTQNEPMPLEDAMTMAFVLDQSGVNVEAMLDLCRAYSPFEMTRHGHHPLVLSARPARPRGRLDRTDAGNVAS